MHWLALLSLFFTTGRTLYFVEAATIQDQGGGGTIRTSSTPPLISVPTYSMATTNADGTTTNMNVITYATPVSVRPDRVWCLGLFKGTLSEENFRRTRTCVLQLLTERHVPIVPVLGGTSGREVNKASACAGHGLAWEQPVLQTIEQGQVEAASQNERVVGPNPQFPNTISVLPYCHTYLHLKVIGEFVDAGSHVIAPYCKVEAMYVTADKKDKSQDGYLSTARLRELGVITEQGRVAEGLV